MRIELSPDRLAALDQPDSSLRNDIAAVLRSVVHGWETVGPISVTRLHGGQSNTIFACSRGTTPADNVILRIYGDGLDAFFARDEELHIFELIAGLNLGLGLLGKFENGRAESFIPGRPLTAMDLREPSLCEKIARKFSIFHGVNLPIDKSPRVLATIDEWFAQAAVMTTPRPVDMRAIADGIARLKGYAARVDSPVVFCHNDLNCSNIMLSGHEVIFIDFEYSHYNPRGFDLGNHFAEWCYFMHGPPVETPDVAMYPTVDDQRRFCRAYLNEKATPDAVEALRLEANVYALAAHLYWATWAIVQSPKSTPDFNYFEYSMGRWSLFLAQEASVVSALEQRLD
ncbi:choline/ethanolamine kinase [Achlya hypogyna]|uniref:Choline/ethanolamine kinase n=1 Tax=Achlya hypogyna TaxID=1202772 RepID=A0A1V9Z4E8_ACHHY|nr:choline/ethanolamine kinase [Achlya hypogyna]